MLQALFYTILVIFIATAVVTLLGIAGRIDIPDRYLKPLFGALLMELVAAVLYLFSTTTFFPDVDDDFMGRLPQAVQAATMDEVQQRITDHVKRSEKAAALQERFDRLQLAHDTLSSAYEALQSSQVRLQEDYDQLAADFADSEKNFLVKIAYLNNAIGRYGNSINLRYAVDEEKREICRRIQEVLQELGHYEGTPDGDPETTYEALVHYQQSKGFTEVGYFSRPTVQRMLTDHLKT